MPRNTLLGQALKHMAKRQTRDAGLQRPAMTLRSAAHHKVRLIVWCPDCAHQVEPDVAAMAARYGAAAAVIDWQKRLVCSMSGYRRIDMVGERSRAIAEECHASVRLADKL